MSIEKHQRSDVQRHLLDKDSGAIPITYGSVGEEPTWGSLLPEIRTKADAELWKLYGLSIDVRWASFIWKKTVHRTPQGDAYCRQWAWALGPTGLTHVEARQGGVLKNRRFFGRGSWSVTVNFVRPSEMTVIRSRLASPLPAVSDSAGERSIGEGYKGEFPMLWSNLPQTVRRAVDQAVPYTAGATREHSESRIEWNERWAQEKIWYDRRGAGMLAAAHGCRTTSACRGPVRTAEHAAASVQGLPWDVVAVRAPLRTGAALGSGMNHKSLKGNP
jgi:hypothetical protein